MVEQQEITEDVPAASPKAPTPKETSFDDPDDYQYAPLPKSGFSIRGLLEWSFEKMRPKSSIVQKKSPSNNTIRDPIKDNAMLQDVNFELSVKELEAKQFLRKMGYIIPGSDKQNLTVPKGYEVQNGLLLQKKSLAEKVRDQLKYPQFKLAGQLIPGVALAAFAIGAIMVYAELPSRPSLVIGIILLCIAGSMITGNYR